MDSIKQVEEAGKFLSDNGVSRTDVGVVLGTGLHRLLHHVDIKQTFPYSAIPGFPVSTVEFHKGNLIYGSISNKSVLIMQGRFHAYEGYTLQQVIFPIRVMKLLGVQQLFLSNAAGGINLSFKKADLVLIEDHINLQNGNPVTGRNLDEFGPRFPDMSEPYDVELRRLILKKANGLKIEIKKGVYAAVNGPNLETKAEYRYPACHRPLPNNRHNCLLQFEIPVTASMRHNRRHTGPMKSRVIRYLFSSFSFGPMKACPI